MTCFAASKSFDQASERNRSHHSVTEYSIVTDMADETPPVNPPRVLENLGSDLLDGRHPQWHVPGKELDAGDQPAPMIGRRSRTWQVGKLPGMAEGDQVTRHASTILDGEYLVDPPEQLLLGRLQ